MKYVKFFIPAFAALLASCSSEEPAQPSPQPQPQPQPEPVITSDVNAVIGGKKYPLEPREEGVFASVVTPPALTQFYITIKDRNYGFLSYSGAGGIGTIKDDKSALPYYNLKQTESTLTFNVTKATGLMAADGNKFSINLPDTCSILMRVDTSGTAPVYYFEKVNSDADVIFEEDFSLCTFGGDYMGAYQFGTMGACADVWDGMTPGKPSSCKGNRTADDNTMFDYPTLVNSTLAGEKYIESRGFSGWEFERVGERPVSIQLGQVKDGVQLPASATTPVFSGASGNVCLEFDMARYSVASTLPIYVDIVGSGSFTLGSCATDGRSEEFVFTDFDNDGKRLSIYDGPFAGHTGANADLDKPVTHYRLNISGASSDTRIKFSVTNDDGHIARCFIFKVKLTRKLLENSLTGKEMPDWSKGYLDIHSVNSGRGECFFYILPDGTSLCVDAGEIKDASNTVPRRPDASTRAYVTYADYMKHFLKATGHDRLDYMSLTHYHIDHMGTFSGDAFAKHSAGFVISGITGVYLELPYNKFIDRIYSASDPDYDSILQTATESSITAASIEPYAKFVSWIQTKGTAVERFKVGTSDQITLLYDKSSYPGFKVFNYAGSGDYWTGSGTSRVSSSVRIAENSNSTVFLMSYGDFDYYAGGDGGTQSSTGCLIARSINRDIDAMKSCHHMSTKTMNEEQMKIFRPSTIVTQSFYVRDDQPQQPTIANILSDSWYSGSKYLYFTNVVESVSVKGGYRGTMGLRGHYVIRVAPGGGSYYVYHLDDSDSSYKVKSVLGPVQSK